MEIKVKRMSIKQPGVPKEKTLREHMEILKGKQGKEHAKRKTFQRKKKEKEQRDKENRKENRKEEESRSTEKEQQTERTAPKSDSRGEKKRSADKEADIEKSKIAKENAKLSFLYKVKQLLFRSEQREENSERRKTTLLEQVALYGAFHPVFHHLLTGVLWVLILTMPAAIFVDLVYQSPYAIFFPTPEGEESVGTVVRTYLTEFREEVNDLVIRHEEHDAGELIYADYEGSSVPDNYYDILGVYMVRHGMGKAATIINEETKGWIREVVDDMCFYTTSSKDREEGSVLCVNVTLRSYRDMISVYEFTEDEERMLSVLMSPVNLTRLGYDSGGSVNTRNYLEQEEITRILEKIEDETCKEVCRFVLQRVGYPYSQDYRDSGNYFDCSSLAFYSWHSAGVNISYEGSTTAAAEAKGLEAKDCRITYEELEPGDLIFWSFCNNGRYKNISHVAIYVGDGMVVEAKDEATGVVYGPVSNIGNIVTICRPKKE